MSLQENVGLMQNKDMNDMLLIAYSHRSALRVHTAVCYMTCCWWHSTTTTGCKL